MTTSPQRIFAFIDSQNVHLAIKELGWSINWSRFYRYLKDKYRVDTAFLFLGYLEGNNHLYAMLQQAGFICIFKPVLRYKSGIIKGNVDAELVMQTMLELPNLDGAIIVSSDDDFYCLIQYLESVGKLYRVLVPNRHKYSGLLKKFAKKKIQC